MSSHVLKENRIVPIESLHPHPQNYRSHPDEQVNDLVASLQRFGPTRSIVVQDGPDGYLIVAGHGLVEAAKKLQIKELRADIIPADWTPAQVKGYLVADNNLSNKSSDDETMLAELLQEQANSGYDLASLGTDDEALRQMLDDIRDTLRIDQERYEEVIDGSDREFGKTPEEYLERYNTTDVRQIVLIYDSQEYARVMAILADLRKREKVETNTEAVTILFEEYVSRYNLEDALCLVHK